MRFETRGGGSNPFFPRKRPELPAGDLRSRLLVTPILRCSATRSRRIYVVPQNRQHNGHKALNRRAGLRRAGEIPADYRLLHRLGGIYGGWRRWVHLNDFAGTMSQVPFSDPGRAPCSSAPEAGLSVRPSSILLFMIVNGSCPGLSPSRWPSVHTEEFCQSGCECNVGGPRSGTSQWNLGSTGEVRRSSRIRSTPVNRLRYNIVIWRPSPE